VFAIAVLAPRIIGWKAGVTLLALFLIHLPFVETNERQLFAYLYLSLAVGLVALNWRQVRSGFS